MLIKLLLAFTFVVAGGTPGPARETPAVATATSPNSQVCLGSTVD
jgi:hypothetical protein